MVANAGDPLGGFEQQLQRERKEEQRTKHARASQERRLKEQSKESLLKPGQLLFKQRAALVATALDAAMTEYMVNPDKPGKHYAALPWLMAFESASQVAAVALAAVLDRMTRKLKYQAMCQAIGAALEDEQRALRLKTKNKLEFRRLMRKAIGSKRRLVHPRTMEMLGCPTLRWENKVRFEVGGHMLELIRANTDLIDIRTERWGRVSSRYVQPTQKAIDFIRSCPPADYQITRTPMACPPRPWSDLYGGGHLGNEEALIKLPVQDIGIKEEAGLSYLRKADLTRVYAVVNQLQNQQLTVDPWMTEQLRIGWDNGIRGLFPCARNPLPIPEELPEGSSEHDWKVRNTQAFLAHRDHRENGPKRVRIERSIQLAEEVAGQTMWNAYHLDFRGRLYTSNRYITHQGPDHEKAAVAFANKQPVGLDGFEWMLKAAANHYGIGRASWDDRLQWGRDNIGLLNSVGQDPFNRLELWRGAKDPWQFLQVAREISFAISNDSHESGLPIRFDQTTSGCGILAALTRNRGIGRLCNLIGSTPRDLYQVVADRTTAKLEWVQHNGETWKERALAEQWLARGIDRSWTKGPVLATPYGASYMSISDGLMDRLEEALGDVGPKEYTLKIAVPCHFLAKILRRELMAVVDPCVEVSRWLKKVSRKVAKTNQPVAWTTPMGLPMCLAERVPVIEKVDTLLFGKRTYSSLLDQPAGAPISAKLINKSISANVVHSFDAAFCQTVIYRAGENGVQLLTNHDCFASIPSQSSTLHQTLHQELRTFYVVDWLTAIKEEIQATTGLKLPNPPIVGDLNVGEIGTNPYCFS